jgi:hypothetical protein
MANSGAIEQKVQIFPMRQWFDPGLCSMVLRSVDAKKQPMARKACAQVFTNNGSRGQ